MDIPSGAKIIKPQKGGQEAFIRSNVDVCFFGGVLNCGKAQPTYSKVFTPKGVKTIGDLKIGDTISDTNGGVQTVLNIYDRGIRKVVRFFLKNGDYVDCCKEHLWDVLINNKLVTVDSSYIINEIDNGETIEIPLSKPVEFNQYKEIKIGREELDLILKKGEIPYSYKFSSIHNRVKLLKQLFCNSSNIGVNDYKIEYSTYSYNLCQDIKWIAQSLGGKVDILLKHSITSDCADFKKEYVLICEFIDERILNEFNIISNNEKLRKSIYNEIVRYDILGDHHMKCILVSNPNHQYITDNFIVTHNTFGAILSIAEWVLIPEFRAVFTRRNLADTKAGGGMLDDIKKTYGVENLKIKESDSPRITFQSGAIVDITHIADENPTKLMERVKGWQYDMVYLDELTSYSWTTFNTIITRNRGSAGIGSKIRGTTNPKKSHWLRKFLNPYIGFDGYIKPEMDRRVMYFYITGEDVESVIWGISKEEVYQKCKIDIDRKLATVNKCTTTFTYENLIKSFSFILGNISENLASIETNKDYIGSVAAAGGKRGQILLEGNWNIDEDEDLDIPIPSTVARSTFLNDPQKNGDRWVTCDLADYGTDNMLAIAWDGLHILDIMILSKSTPVMNAEKLKLFASQWDVSDSHIIFDGNNGRYINDYIPEAIPFISYYKPYGMYSRAAVMLKDEAYLRLVYIINNGMLSWEEGIARRKYQHQKNKDQINIESEFAEECSVVRFIEVQSGKKKLATKKQMNQMLGKGRSMDLLDPIAMRMLPFANFQYGDELIKTSEYEYEEDNNIYKDNIYDDSFWA